MPKDLEPVELIKQRQQAWAERKQRVLDSDGYCGNTDDNIYQGLSDPARTDFLRGGGREVGNDGERGNIQAAHSSAALVCNWFDYWRERDFAVLSTALGVPTPFVTLRLEAHVPTGMRGPDANLDVLLTTADGSLFGIESQFTEPYAGPPKNTLKPQYFAQGKSRWADVGLPGCQVVADHLHTGNVDFPALDVAQLLKHMLALGRTGNRWTLCCLWYEVPGPTAEALRADLATFLAQIGGDAVHFKALTYQELFSRIEPLAGAGHGEYIAYLRDRYLTDAELR